MAAISGWDEQGEPVYAGGSEMNWDAQHLITDENDQMVVVDEDGEEWSLAKCEAREEADQDDDE